MKLKIDKLRTLIWVNRIRINNHKRPLLKLPKDIWPTARPRMKYCPIARAIDNDLSAGKLGIFLAYPAYVRRVMDAYDRAIWLQPDLFFIP